MRTVACEVDAVERHKKRHRLFPRNGVSSANTSVARHGRQDEIRRIPEGPLRGPPELGHQITNETLGAATSEKHRHSVDGDRLRTDRAQLDSERKHVFRTLFERGDLSGKELDHFG
jgi:hypothetical protein